MSHSSRFMRRESHRIFYATCLGILLLASLPAKADLVCDSTNTADRGSGQWDVEVQNLGQSSEKLVEVWVPFEGLVEGSENAITGNWDRQTFGNVDIDSDGDVESGLHFYVTNPLLGVSPGGLMQWYAQTTAGDLSLQRVKHVGSDGGVCYEWFELPANLPSTLPGDLDLDGQVTFLECATVAARIGLSPAEWADGDFDDDGAVDVADADAAIDSYTGWPAPPSAIPEPASISLLCVGLAAIVRRR